MMIQDQIRGMVLSSLKDLYGHTFEEKDFQVNQTKPEFEGDYTIVLFSLVKSLRKSPDQLGSELGSHLMSIGKLIKSFNLIKGFLNLTISDQYWLENLSKHYDNPLYGRKEPSGRRVMVEYSSPNTNKPLHLGHLRNNFLGLSVAHILEAVGDTCIKTCIVNDRGIHICKSMVAWQHFGNGATPVSTGQKGDHFVGGYYVRYNEEYKKQVEELIASGLGREEAEKGAPILLQAQQMLVDWEAGKPEVIRLWKLMNEWVYTGFEETYQKIGSSFDKTYYESETYLLGKKLVAMGLEKGVFKTRDDGSVWIDLTADGLDEKIVQRKDGTAVYMTQDIGLAVEKYEEFKCDQSIYVVGDEQNYHFRVLKLICEKLQIPNAEGIYHLSYGMVELPTGKMKSREGTVVDADDLIAEMIGIAGQHTEDLGKVQDFTEEELAKLYEVIGMGALKFFLLRVDPKKKMIFNPEESIDFHGFTGPFVQYAHARIQSVLRKESIVETGAFNEPLLPLERELLISLEQYGTVIETAALQHDPSVVALYVYNLARLFNSFYAEHSIARAESAEKQQLRLRISKMTSVVIRSGMELLNIEVPERM